MSSTFFSDGLLRRSAEAVAKSRSPSGSASMIEKTLLVGCRLPENCERFAVSVADRVSENDQPRVAVLNSPVWSVVRSASAFSQCRSNTRADAETWLVLSVRICPGSEATSM